MRNSVAVRWTGYVAFAIVFAIACAFLANWQFDRNEWRTNANHLIATNYDATPVPLAEAIPAGSGFDKNDEWQPITMTGTYLVDQQILVNNRPRGGTRAFEVLVPFQSEDGRTLLVDRGWVGSTEESTAADVPASPGGTVTVIVRLRPDEPAPTSGRTAPPGEVPTLTTALVQEQISAELIPSVYGLLASETPAADAYPNVIPAPEQDPGPHLSYAIQWILFALMGFIFIGYMIKTEIRHKKEDQEKADGTFVPKPKRRDSDSAEEDELLDAGA